MISPGDSATVSVTADLDDTAAFADELILDVTESPPLRVPLLARGSGTPLQPDVDLTGSGLDFGPCFTTAEQTRTVVIENRGRRQLALSWVNATVRGGDGSGENQKKSKAAAAATADGVTAPVNVFSVDPPNSTVKAGGSVSFIVKW